MDWPRIPHPSGETARRVRSSASGSCPHTQTGSSGGQTQPLASSAKKRFTRRSSREWNEIAAMRPPRSQELPRCRAERHRPPRARSSRRCESPGRSSWPDGPCRTGRRQGRRPGSHRRARTSSRTACRATISRAIERAWRSSPSSRSVSAMRFSGQSFTTSRAESSCVGSIRMSRGRVVGIGEAALPGVELHRGDAQVHVDDVSLGPFGDRGARGRRRSCPGRRSPDRRDRSRSPRSARGPRDRDRCR